MNLSNNPTELYLSVDQLSVDPKYQRPLVPRQLDAMSGDKYDPRVLGNLVVSRRDNGTYVVIDGQHRLKVVATEDPHRKLACTVYEDLTPEVEAELFLLYNNQAPVNALARFQAAVMAGRDLPTAVYNILAKHGLDVGGGQHDVSAVADCMRIATWQPDGLNLLDQALSILSQAFTHVTHPQGVTSGELVKVRGNRPYRGTLIAGMARVILRYREAIDRDRMVKVLIEAGNFAPRDLISAADTIKSAHRSISTEEAVASLLVKTYNKGHGGKKVTAWLLDGSVVEEGVGARYSANDLIATKLTDGEG